LHRLMSPGGASWRCRPAAPAGARLRWRRPTARV